MAAIAPNNLLIMSDATLKIGATDTYEKSVSSVKLTPTVPVATWKAVSGDPYASAGKPSWVCEITYAQDWKSAASLSQYLLTNAGSTVAIIATPTTAGKTFTFNAIIVPGDVGGEVDSIATATVTLAVIGQPVVA